MIGRGAPQGSPTTGGALCVVPLPEGLSGVVRVADHGLDRKVHHHVRDGAEGSGARGAEGMGPHTGTRGECGEVEGCVVLPLFTRLSCLQKRDNIWFCKKKPKELLELGEIFGELRGQNDWESEQVSNTPKYYFVCVQNPVCADMDSKSLQFCFFPTEGQPVVNLRGNK